MCDGRHKIRLEFFQAIAAPGSPKGEKITFSRNRYSIFHRAAIILYHRKLRRHISYTQFQHIIFLFRSPSRQHFQNRFQFFLRAHCYLKFSRLCNRIQNIIYSQLNRLHNNTIHIRLCDKISDTVRHRQPKIIDYSTAALCIEVTGDTEKLDAFIEIMKPLGIIEMCRTGIVALERGEGSIFSVGI